MNYQVKKLTSMIEFNFFTGDKYYRVAYSISGETVWVLFKRPYGGSWNADAECAEYTLHTEIPEWDFTVKCLPSIGKRLAEDTKFYADVCRAEGLRKLQKKFDELKNRK